MAHANMTTFSLERYPVRLEGPSTIVADLAELNDILIAAGHVDDINWDNLQCPRCDAVHPFVKWNDAWINPGDYFEADDLCACGGELWWSHLPDRPAYAHVCERCGWVRPKAIVSGTE
jgi:hypothetical protein